MNAAQPDLFAPASRAAETPDPAMVAMVRARLHRVLDLVRAAPAMPWSDQLTIIHQDNGFRHGKDLLPLAEGAALWAEFDAHMDRLYAIMNAGKDMD